ncbi:MAG: hypothetical protein HOP03_05450 [Lysobacter sp.]|nr:hypothetical protein [Lysobacter sp.]
MIYALFLAAQLVAADTSFADAKARADEYESVLSHKDSAALIEAQGKALSAAVAECGPASRSFPPFAIVARVGNTGVTERTWRNDDSPFAICLDLHLARALLPVAAGKPFYASYELGSAP